MEEYRSDLADREHVSKTSLAGDEVASYWSRLSRMWDPMLRVIGLHRRYRREAVSVLQLQNGDTVLDVACGTGLNFPLLYQTVGPRGRIIAVDIARGMLDRARERVEREGYGNVELVLGDITKVKIPRVDSAVACWSMISIPNYRKALERIVKALLPGGRIAILDFKLIDGFPGQVINPVFEAICRLTYQDATREPWVDLEQMLGPVEMLQWRFGGLLSNVYLAWSEKPSVSHARSNALATRRNIQGLVP